MDRSIQCPLQSRSAFSRRPAQSHLVGLKESKISLIAGATITVGTVLGYSAMAGILGGGGLGDIAIRYGYYRYQPNILWVSVILLVAIVMILQGIGTLISKKFDRRKK